MIATMLPCWKSGICKVAPCFCSTRDDSGQECTACIHPCYSQGEAFHLHREPVRHTTVCKVISGDNERFSAVFGQMVCYDLQVFPG